MAAPRARSPATGAADRHQSAFKRPQFPRGRPIGLTYAARDGLIFVAAVAPGSPAESHGIAAGDKLIFVHDRYVTSMVAGQEPLTVEALLALEAEWFGPDQPSPASEPAPAIVYRFSSAANKAASPALAVAPASASEAGTAASARAAAVSPRALAASAAFDAGESARTRRAPPRAPSVMVASPSHHVPPLPPQVLRRRRLSPSPCQRVRRQWQGAAPLPPRRYLRLYRLCSCTSAAGGQPHHGSQTAVLACHHL